MDKHKEKHQTRSNPMAMPTVVLGIIMIVMLVFMISINTQLTKIANAFEGGVDTGNEAAPTPAAAPTPTPTPSPAPQLNLADDDEVKGDANAPVEIVEFSDFECPFCGRFFTQTYGQIKENYIDTGKVKLIHRDFPLGFHANAQKAAEASECAADQGMFWEMHDLLYGGAALDVASLKQHAVDLGMDADEFNDCLDSGKHEAEVKKDFADGQAAGVSGTPSFFINGKKIVGAQPYSVFEQEIEAALG